MIFFMIKEIIKLIIVGIIVALALNKYQDYSNKKSLKEKEIQARQRIKVIREKVFSGGLIPKYVPEFYLECKNIFPPHDDDLQYLKDLNDKLTKMPAAKRKPAAKKKPAARKVPLKK